MEKTFTFAKADAVEIAYIIQRNRDNDKFLRELLLRAVSLDKLLSPLAH